MTVSHGPASRSVPNVVRARGLIKRYGALTAIDGVDLTLDEGRIYGLLGRNGAGKTTMMQLLTGQLFPSGGELTAFGQPPAEHADALRRMCFVAEAQRYPENFAANHVLKAAPWFFEHCLGGVHGDRADHGGQWGRPREHARGIPVQLGRHRAAVVSDHRRRAGSRLDLPLRPRLRLHSA